MRVAVVGAGISGLVSAYVLAKSGMNMVLYEKEDYLGGHAKTVNADGIDLDLGFMVFNWDGVLIVLTTINGIVEDGEWWYTSCKCHMIAT